MTSFFNDKTSQNAKLPDLAPNVSRAVRRAFSKLPPISGVIQQVMSQLSDPGVTVQQVAVTVEQDQVLAARVLRLVNSPFFGLERQVTSIKQAVILLGFNTVKQMLFSFGINNSLKKISKNISFDMDGFWDHSLVTAIIARKFARQIPGIELDSAFSAGLLHDIGMVLLYMAFPKEYEKLIQQSYMDNFDTLITVEKNKFGITHAEAGYLLGVSWNFPSPILESILHHHDIFDYEKKNKESEELLKMMELVAFADQISYEVEHGLNELTYSYVDWSKTLIYPYCSDFLPFSSENVNNLKQYVEDILVSYRS